MAKYQKYAEYKDSGVEWLDVIPSHWVMSKIKYIAPFQVGWTPPTGNDSNFIGENIWANISDLRGKIITDTVKRISDKAAKEASMGITPKGSLLYSFKLSVGSVSFAGRDMYTNEAIASFTSDSLLALEYLYYVLPKFLIENASTNIYGARILNQELIRNAIILKPTYEEAKTIANFLDYETAQIDTLIEKQQILIQLLKEKRQAVISHAVTKGLNPDASMKVSGVEWLGEMPEHWRNVSISKVFSIKAGGDLQKNSYSDFKTAEHQYPIYTNANSETAVYGYTKFANYSSNSITVSGRGEVGFAVFRDHKFDAIIRLLVLTPSSNKKIDGRFFAYFINEVIDFNEQSSAIGQLSTLQIAPYRIFVPPHREQIEISNYLDLEKVKINQLIRKSNEQIQLMQERRTALISAAVTGKIDVRGWQAPDVIDNVEVEVESIT